MNSVAAAEAVLLLFLLVGLMGAWDGLVRRHIRYDVDVVQLHVSFRGWVAVATGIVGAMLALLAGKIAVTATWQTVIGCRNGIACATDKLVLPLLTTWQALLVVIVTFVVFALWASGAGDLTGPYTRRYLAPGVWDTDKEILAAVSGRLHARRLPNVNADTVMEMASWVRQSLMLFRRAHRDTVTRNGRLDPAALVEVLISTRAVHKFGVDEAPLRVVLKAIADYYRDKYEQAARVWPWRRRVIPY